MPAVRTEALLYLTVAALALVRAADTTGATLQQIRTPDSLGLPMSRTKRSAYHIIKDCIVVTSEEGQFFHKSTADDAPTVCGVYIVTDPDRRVEVHFDYLDVPCENGGLVSFVDGWELNQQFFPSAEDHPKPLNQRYREFCGQRNVKQVLESSQNAGLIQYRMPGRGRGFSFTVRFPRNPTPCNILLEGTADVYTLRNYRKRANCSLTTLYPASVKVLSLNVGLQDVEVETGTVHKCQKRGLPDYLQIGGSEGLDTTHLTVADSICGLNSKPGSSVQTIFCGVTTARLVSSGQFDNAVTLALAGTLDHHHHHHHIIIIIITSSSSSYSHHVANLRLPVEMAELRKELMTQQQDDLTLMDRVKTLQAQLYERSSGEADYNTLDEVKKVMNVLYHRLHSQFLPSMLYNGLQMRHIFMATIRVYAQNLLYVSCIRF